MEKFQLLLFLLYKLFLSAFGTSNNISALQNDVNLLKNEIKDLKKNLNWLKGENIRLWEDVHSTDRFCSMSGESNCGPCKCRDNYKLTDKYYCDCHNLTPERDCRSFHEKGLRVDGVYTVHNNNMKLMQVFCDQTTDGGGWTVFQRRRDGTVNFYRDWFNYKVGFGDLANEFWLGNENLYTLSLQSLPRRSELRVELGSWDGSKRFAKYGDFQIGDELTKYRIHLSNYNGDAGDGFTNYGSSANGHMFSTYDSDNDIWNDNCGAYHKSGWWFDHCYLGNLNGPYFYYQQYTSGAGGLHWYTLDSHKTTLKTAEMKIRRK